MPPSTPSRSKTAVPAEPVATPAPADAPTPTPPKGRSKASRLLASRAALSDTVAAAVDLLEEGDRAHAGIANDARDLLLSEIEPDPGQPRRHFDPSALRDLAEDIARRGVLQPILVRPSQAPGERYRIVAGERRWRASQMAGKVRIPARVRAMSDDDVTAAQLAENVLRADLSDIEKGRTLRRLYEIRKHQDHRATWEDIAREVGLGRARIHDLFHLADLPEPVARLIEEGRLSGSHGIVLQRAQESLAAEEIETLARRAARPETRTGGSYGLSVARLRAAVQAAVAAQQQGSQEASVAGVSDASPPAMPSAGVRPFLRRTLDALQAGKLSAAERRLLVEALGHAGGSSGPPPVAPEGS